MAGKREKKPGRREMGAGKSAGVPCGDAPGLPEQSGEARDIIVPERPIIPLPREQVRKGVRKVLHIVKGMLEDDVHHYGEIGDTQIGNVRVQHVLGIRFLDDSKKGKKKKGGQG